MNTRALIAITTRFGMFGALVIAGNCAHATEQDERAWDMVATKIHAFVVGKDKDFDTKYLIQLPTVPVYADWTDKKYLYSLYMLGDSVPKWGPVWFPTNATFSDAYQQFAYSLALPTPTALSQSNANAYSKAQKAYATVVDNARKDWLAADAKQKKDHPNQPAAWVSKQQWYANHAATNISLARDALIEAFVTYQNGLDPNTQILGKWQQKVVNAQTVDIRMPISAEQFNADDNDPTTWTTEPRLPIKFGSNDLAAVIKDGQAQFNAKKPEDVWILDNAATTSHYATSSWGASASYGPFFHASASHKETSIDLTAQGTFVKFGYYKLAQIPVGPLTNWYTDQLVRTYACGPFKDGSKVNATSLWGPNGSLSAIPVSVIVAYRPFINVQLTDTQYKFFQTSTSGSGGLSIGPFGIGGGGSSFKQDISDVKHNGYIEVTSTSDTPMVIAVIYEKLPGKPCP